MNELTALSNDKLTMSSREIAELTGKEHGHVMRDIRNLEVKLEGMFEGYIQKWTHPQNNQEYECYILSKDTTLTLLLGYDAVARMKVIKRWQELEAQQQPQFTIPQTLSEALRLAADQAETIEAQQLLLEQQKPAVQFLENFVETKSTKGLREVAKVLGLKEREFIAALEEQKILFRQSGQLLPFAQFHHSGYFEVKTGEANGHAFHQTRFTPKGISWITKRLGLVE